MFRFHTGSIKRKFKGLIIESHQISFDSILVRLKVNVEEVLQDFSFLGFDSILVRLKACLLRFILRALPRFRFHTGSIKRRFSEFKRG